MARTRTAEDRSQPKEGRCNAKTAGGYCWSWPQKGNTRCRIHGGASQTFASRLKRVNAAGQAEFDQALKDPQLLDTRRPIALAEVVLTNTAVLPSDEVVARVARRRIVAAVGTELMAALAEAKKAGGDETRAAIEELLTPTEADMEEARTTLHEQSMRIIGMYSKRQIEAVKLLEWARVIREQAMPLFAEFALKMGAVLRKHVPPERMEAALQDTRNAMTLTVGELAALRDSQLLKR